MKDVSMFPDFTPLSLSHKKTVTMLSNNLKNPTSHRLFSNIFITDTDNTTKLSQLNNTIIVDRGLYKDCRGVMVIGENDVSHTYSTLFKYGVQFIELVPTVLNGATLDLDNSDYVYSMENVRYLKGSSFANVRRKVKKCVGMYEERILQGDCSSAIWSLFQKWASESLQKRDEGEKGALEKALRFFNSLDIEYIGVYDNNAAMVAFAGVEVLANKVLMIHFFKTLPHRTGLSEYLFYKLAFLYQSRCSTINFQQDLGIEGLKRFKQSLRPIDILSVYTVRQT